MTHEVLKSSATMLVAPRALVSRAANRVRRESGFTLLVALDPGRLTQFVSETLPDYTNSRYRRMATADPDLVARLGLPDPWPGAGPSGEPREAAVLAVAARLYYFAAAKAFHGDPDDPADTPGWFLGSGLRDPGLLPYPSGVTIPPLWQRLVDYWYDPEAKELFVVYDNGHPDGSEERVLRPGDSLYPVAHGLLDWRTAYNIRVSERRRFAMRRMPRPQLGLASA